MIEISSFITKGEIEVGISFLAVIVRLFSRWKLVGVRKWEGDDLSLYLGRCAVLLALLMVAVFLVGKVLATNTGWSLAANVNWCLCRLLPAELPNTSLDNLFALSAIPQELASEA
ncbi:hypothetical protein BJY01DRAFT_118950 [Aspergillus pseudoustus]|uniref:Uncharacterized protein n=1 Tax=Aspergillus pseudoustus TaxID=1810923 RepID=A0ABR4IRL0_9EURO